MLKFWRWSSVHESTRWRSVSNQIDECDDQRVSADGAVQPRPLNEFNQIVKWPACHCQHSEIVVESVPIAVEVLLGDGGDETVAV